MNYIIEYRKPGDLEWTVGDGGTYYNDSFETIDENVEHTIVFPQIGRWEVRIRTATLGWGYWSVSPGIRLSAPPAAK